jgi:hypothetical protein
MSFSDTEKFSLCRVFAGIEKTAVTINAENKPVTSPCENSLPSLIKNFAAKNAIGIVRHIIEI